MINTRLPSRRRLLATSLASVGAFATAAPLRALGVSTSAPPIVATAKRELARVGSHITAHDVVGVADFGRSSSQPRLHLVDMAAGTSASFLVAHGKGSDPHHTGWLEAFSNAPGSDATCRGAFVTGERYEGQHGRSMRLDGLDPSNDNARSRGIVVHSAWYVGQGIIQNRGMLGRSEGCFAVSRTDLDEVLTRLGTGRLLVATKL